MVRDKSKLPISIQENKKVKLMVCDIRESNRYKNLVDQGLLHTCSTIRDRDNIHSAKIIGMSLDKKAEEAL